MSGTSVEIGLTGVAPSRGASVAGLVANLAELLTALVVSGRTVAVVVDLDDRRYVQFWVDRSGVISGEVSSTSADGGRDPDRALELRTRGFAEPSDEGRPNWWVEARGRRGALEVAARTSRALVEVLGCAAGDSVSVRTFEPFASDGSSDRPPAEAGGGA